MAFESQLSEEWPESSTLDQLINDIFQDPTISAFINNYSVTEDTTHPPPSQASVGSPTPSRQHQQLEVAVMGHVRYPTARSYTAVL